jgi:hypothetical protein
VRCFSWLAVDLKFLISHLSGVALSECARDNVVRIVRQPYIFVFLFPIVELMHTYIDAGRSDDAAHPSVFHGSHQFANRSTDFCAHAAADKGANYRAKHETDCGANV